MNSESYNFLVTASASSRSSENRIDRLESLVEKLATQVSTLATDPGKNRYSVDLTCEHCHKRGHTKSRCFKLMTCTKCSKIGHIAKFCTESEHSQPPSTSATETEINSSTTETENVSLPNAPRIVLPISISNQNLEFLYDPGSMFTMIPRANYKKLTKKPPLCPINRCGVGVSNQKFKIDGVAHLNLALHGTSNEQFILNYEPVLVSSDIKMCIFGIHSEDQFEEIKRSHKQNIVSFRTKHGDEIKLKFFRESSASCAFIETCKSTVVENDKIHYVSAKIKGIPP